MMLAVLEQRGRISALGKRDIYSATVGGVKLSEPAADLAIALALASAATDTPCPRTSWRSAKWASRARSEGSPGSSAACPKHTVSASRTRSFRPIPARFLPV